MSAIMASAPSGSAVGLIVGTGTVTIAAMWATVGYFAKRFLSQQERNHADTLEALGIAREIRSQLPPLVLRLTRLEVAAVAAGAWAAFIAWRRR